MKKQEKKRNDSSIKVRSVPFHPLFHSIQIRSANKGESKEPNQK